MVCRCIRLSIVMSYGEQFRLAHMAPVRRGNRLAEVCVAPHNWPAKGVCKGSHAR